MKIALGTVQFGLLYGVANQCGQISRDAARHILTYALESGIDTLDTAISYGESEACLGEVGTNGFNLVTKLPAIPDNVTDVSRWVSEQVQASLQRLGVNSLYGLLLHRPQQLAGSQGKVIARALQRLKNEGVVRKVGVSIYSPSELEISTQACPIDLVQAPFNVLDRRLYSSGWLARLHDSGVEIHTRSAFLQGLLLLPNTQIQPKFKPWDSLFLRWHEWLRDSSTSAAQACLQFSLSFAEIDRVVVGVDSEAQLKELVRAAQSPQLAQFPEFACDDERLINPANWNQLETI